MKYPEYDSPFEFVVSDITTQMARNIDEMCWQAIQRVGINVDKDKLLIALRKDAERYREAYANGYDTGYEKRGEEIVRCKDCEHWGEYECHITNLTGQKSKRDWFCADGERKSD